MKIRAGVVFLVGVALVSSVVSWWPTLSKKQDLAEVQEKKTLSPALPSASAIPSAPALPIAKPSRPAQEVDQPWGLWGAKPAIPPENLDTPPAWGWKLPSSEPAQDKTWGWEVVDPAQPVSHPKE